MSEKVIGLGGTEVLLNRVSNVDLVFSVPRFSERKTMSKMTLNFSNSPVPVEAIEAALKKQKEASDESRALAYADDMRRCQNAVDAGRRHLKALRKAADDFAAEFKKLEGHESAPSFAAALNGNPALTREIGAVRLCAEYDNE